MYGMSRYAEIAHPLTNLWRNTTHPAVMGSSATREFVRCDLILRRLPIPSQFELVIVVGPHKSGTSLLTEILSESFFDPSRVTNPLERGFGKTVERYITRECDVVRWINKHILLGQQSACTALTSQPFRAEDAILTYLQQWRRPFVVKSPYFAYTLQLWINCAMKIGIRVCVCFTTRNATQLAQAWSNAPFTRQLGPTSTLPELIRACHWQWRECQSRGVTPRAFNHSDLVAFSLLRSEPSTPLK